MTKPPHWHIDVDEKLDIVRIVLGGSIDLERWLQVLRDVPQTPGFRLGIPSLVDARGARLDFFHKDGTVLAERLGPYLQSRGGGPFRSAWVVDSDADFGVTRMVQTLLADLPIEAMVFREMAEAERWVTG